jgi:peptidoglycan/xylan/chitin deacetylase (PgdA/CDA1 family)
MEPIKIMKPIKQMERSNNAKPLASLSLDLDNLWSYMKTHGDSGWVLYPSYLDLFIPRVLDILDDFKLKITFFIVGQDAALEKNRTWLSRISERGHEVGNHSFHHEPWLHLYPKEKIKREILQAQEHILQVTGQRPVGFRGPGFSWSPDLLEVLAENGYLYDASTLPTYLGPLARAYYFWKSDLADNEKEERRKLFGGIKEGRRPVRPYLWNLDGGRRLLEIPVTTMPVFKIPFHLSYLVYLSRYSAALMVFYLKVALTLCRMTNTAPSFLLHPLDFLGGEQVPELDFFPGMDLGQGRKTGLFELVMKVLCNHLKLGSVGIHARSILCIEGNLDILS